MVPGEWFLEAFPAGTTPAMQGSPGGVDSGEWVGDLDEILARAKTQHPRFAQVACDRGPLTTQQAGDMCTRLAMSQFAALFAESESEGGKQMLGYLMDQAKVKFDVIEGETGVDTKRRLIGIALEMYAEVEAVLCSLPGPGVFLGGEAPDQADAFMGTMLFWCHNALESGLSPVPQAPCSLADVGAPSVRGYLEAWVARPSWKACYKTDSLFSAAHVMVAAGIIAKTAPDVCNGGKDMFVVMERARRLDRGYCTAVGLDKQLTMREQQPAPTGALVPGMPRKVGRYELTSSADPRFAQLTPRLPPTLRTEI